MDKMKFYGVIYKLDRIAGFLAILAWMCLSLVFIIPNIVYMEIVFMTLSLISVFVALVLTDIGVLK